MNGLRKQRGTYIVLFYLSRKRKITVGSLGPISFEKAYYLYVGSGMNNVFKRIERHKKKDKRKRWHIDYLSSDSYVRFIDAWVVFDRVEKEIAHYLFYTLSLPNIRGFGASDSPIPSHLFYFSNYSHFLNILEKLKGSWVLTAL